MRIHLVCVLIFQKEFFQSISFQLRFVMCKYNLFGIHFCSIFLLHLDIDKHIYLSDYILQNSHANSHKGVTYGKQAFSVQFICFLLKFRLSKRNHHESDLLKHICCRKASICIGSHHCFCRDGLHGCQIILCCITCRRTCTFFYMYDQNGSYELFRQNVRIFNYNFFGIFIQHTFVDIYDWVIYTCGVPYAQLLQYIKHLCTLPGKVISIYDWSYTNTVIFQILKFSHIFS